jgi:GGDEF domain-containing protein
MKQATFWLGEDHSHHELGVTTFQGERLVAAEQLIRRADEALHLAKQNGRVSRQGLPSQRERRRSKAPASSV